MGLRIRAATLDDSDELRSLMAWATRELSKGHYTQAQIEAAVGTTMGLDTQLIRDGTYFVVVDDAVVVDGRAQIVASGGWGKRKTLFGADSNPGREAALLDPATEPARIRAFYVRPDRARQGLGLMLLEHCEQQIRAAGFKAAQLAATGPGRPLYEKAGYVGVETKAWPLPGGLTIEFLTMRKQLA